MNSSFIVGIIFQLSQNVPQKDWCLFPDVFMLNKLKIQNLWDVLYY